MRKKKGKREYLNNKQTKDLMNNFSKYFESTVEVPRMKIGKKQCIEALINEEALLLAQCIMSNRKIWKPRTV